MIKSITAEERNARSSNRCKCDGDSNRMKESERQPEKQFFLNNPTVFGTIIRLNDECSNADIPISVNFDPRSNETERREGQRERHDGGNNRTDEGRQRKASFEPANGDPEIFSRDEFHSNAR
jgi:hypothetical protein